MRGEPGPRPRSGSATRPCGRANRPLRPLDALLALPLVVPELLLAFLQGRRPLPGRLSRLGGGGRGNRGAVERCAELVGADIAPQRLRALSVAVEHSRIAVDVE